MAYIVTNSPGEFQPVHGALLPSLLLSIYVLSICMLSAGIPMQVLNELFKVLCTLTT